MTDHINLSSAVVCRSIVLRQVARAFSFARSQLCERHRKPAQLHACNTPARHCFLTCVCNPLYASHPPPPPDTPLIHADTPLTHP